VDQRDKDIIAFHWPLLALVVFLVLVNVEWTDVPVWALIGSGLLFLGIVPSYLYVVVRLHRMSLRPLVRIGWCALYLGIWPFGGPLCYWLWFRKAAGPV